MDYVNKYSLLELKICSSYILEILRKFNIIKYNINLCIYKVQNLDLKLFEITLLVNKTWPLIREPQNYIFQKDTLEYIGGFFFNKINIKIKNKRIKDIILTSDFVSLINNLQKVAYYLITNKNKILILKKYMEFLLENILTKEDSRKLILISKLKKYKDYNFDDSLELELSNWFMLYQYFIFIENKIDKIYFVFQIDCRGRIYNAIKFGLNPTLNKLSRILLNVKNREYLTEFTKVLLKQYIFKLLKIKSENEFLIIYNDILIELNEKFKNFNFLKYSIEVYIIMIDWIENVILHNYTELSLEIDASQSGFQILAIFSNNLKLLQDTDIIRTSIKEDLYLKFLNKLKIKYQNKNIFSIIDRSMIKKLIMTIPYGSSEFSQKLMLLQSYLSKYSLRYLFENKKDIGILVESDLITDFTLKVELQTFYFMIINEKIDSVNLYAKIDVLQRKIEMDLLKNIFSQIVEDINNFLNLEYNEILNFIISYKKRVLNKKSDIFLESDLISIKTKWLIYFLTYYKETKKIGTIGNTKYINYELNMLKKDNLKIEQGLIANLVQGLGDSFILHNIIFYGLQTGIYLYPIHDGILCNFEDLAKWQLIILKSYNEVYNFIRDNKVFELEVIDKNLYIFDSLLIFK